MDNTTNNAMKYELNLSFANEMMGTLDKSNQKVVLVKHTAGNSDTAVSWVSFKPWEHNTIEWSESFAVYASNTQVDHGATIRKLSDKKAATGICYPFRAGYFNTPVPGNDFPKNTYIIKNNDDELDGITVGLAQDVVVNGRAYVNNPINAVYVPRGQYATMSPLETIDIYLRNDIEDGTVISHIYSTPLTIVYNEGESAHEIGYDSRTGEFYQIS